jgi:hypothetical protein
LRALARSIKDAEKLNFAGLRKGRMLLRMKASQVAHTDNSCLQLARATTGGARLRISYFTLCRHEPSVI